MRPPAPAVRSTGRCGSCCGPPWPSTTWTSRCWPSWELVVTQDLCLVCAVSYGAVCAAVDQLAVREVALVSLHPERLDDIWGDICRVASALDHRAGIEVLLAGLLGRLARVERQAEGRAGRPRVVTVEWLEPVRLGGTWMTELIAAAGGTPLGVTAGQQAPILDLAGLERLEP